MLPEPVVDDNHAGAEASGLICRGNPLRGATDHPKTRFRSKHVTDNTF